MKRFPLLLVCAIWLAGCSGNPDATLLGVVLVPPKAVSAGPRAAAPPAPAPAPAATAPAPARGPTRVAPQPAAPAGGQNALAYARPTPGPTLKSSREVSATEEELRRLAARRPEAGGRGLWNTQIRSLLTLRNTHASEAARKIEQGSGE